MTLFSPEQDAAFMREAMALAQEAGRCGEVPVGALIVAPDGSVAGRGFNQPILRHDPTAHAEVMALRAAAEAMGNYRLPAVRCMSPSSRASCARGRSCMPASGGWCLVRATPKRVLRVAYSIFSPRHV